jgi:multidrug resistance efflux pump
VAVEEANLKAAQHRVEHDLVNADRAERDRVRYLALVDKKEISRSEYDARESEARAAAATSKRTARRRWRPPTASRRRRTGSSSGNPM